MSLKDEIRDMRMDPPAGDWDESLNERDETIEVCPDCLELLTDCECKYFSPCCGADMRTGNGDASAEDYGICPECREHI